MLDLREPSQAGRAPFLAAASGLVRAGSHLYVVADDELELGVFPLEGTEPGHLVPLWSGALPLEARERKRRKPDLEALVRLPPVEGFRGGALLAMGSGSTLDRRRGALLRLGEDGGLLASPVTVELGPLYERLSSEVGELNVEGAAVRGGSLVLLQRGNRTTPSGLVELSLAEVMAALEAGAPLPASTLRGIRPLVLGDAGGVPLTPTDASPLPDGWLVVTAVSEDTSNSYEDGPCVAAAVAVLDEEGKPRWVERLEAPHKVEGVHAQADPDGLRLLMVCDADEPKVPSTLLSALVGGFP